MAHAKLRPNVRPIPELWDVIEQLEADGSYSKGFATLLRQTFVRFIYWLLPHLQLELLGSSQESVRIGWSEPSDSEHSPDEVLTEALTEHIGEWLPKFCSERFEKQQLATFRSEFSAIRTLCKLLREHGLTSFDPDRLQSPEAVAPKSKSIPLADAFIRRTYATRSMQNQRRYLLSQFFEFVRTSTGTSASLSDEQAATVLVLRAKVKGHSLATLHAKLLDTVTGQMLLNAAQLVDAFAAEQKARSGGRQLFSAIR
ncbi:MAG: hypothetical protein KDD69_15000, partial [Bdellovibrionales bacterium]|nr:hypothetical protein [Bdellovibrionales bacterium]